MKLAEALRAGGISVVLKGATVLAKFLVILYVGRILSLEDLGDYGLLVATIAILVQVVGLDFYLVNNRAILAFADSERRSPLVWDQVHLHLAAYLVLMVVLVLGAVMGLVSWAITGWLLVLGIAEHASQELSRLLVAVGRPVVGNVILFVRMGAWGWAVAALAGSGLWLPDLFSVLAMWTVATYASVFIGLVVAAREGLLVRRQPPDRSRIRDGLRQARVFLVATIAFQMMHLSDRFFIELFMDRAALGIYTFLYSVTGLVSTAVATSVIMIFGPRVVEAVLQGAREEEARLVAYLDRGVIATTVVLVAAMSLTFRPLAGLLDKPEVLTESAAFLVLLGGAAVVNLASLPYYRLYARGREASIMWASLLGGSVNAGANLVLIPRLGLTGAAVATVLGFAAYGAFMATMSLRADEHGPTRPAGG